MSSDDLNVQSWSLENSGVGLLRKSVYALCKVFSFKIWTFQHISGEKTPHSLSFMHGSLNCQGDGLEINRLQVCCYRVFCEQVVL